MHVKLFEVRDNGTCIAAIAIRPGLDDIGRYVGVEGADGRLAQRRFLLGKAGFNAPTDAILFGFLDGSGGMHCDPYDWPASPRTMRAAHLMAERDWADLDDGDVLDVRVFLGERETPVESDCR